MIFFFFFFCTGLNQEFVIISLANCYFFLFYFFYRVLPSNNPFSNVLWDPWDFVTCVFCALLCPASVHWAYALAWALETYSKPFCVSVRSPDIFLRWLFLQKLRDHASLTNKEGNIKSNEWGLETEKDA